MSYSKRPLSATSESRSKGTPLPPYTTSLPLLMVLIILILSSAKDTLNLVRRKNALRAAHAQAVGPLVYAGKQAQYVMSIRDDLTKLAVSDPVAAQIVADFFPPTPTPSGQDETDKESQPINQGTSR